MAAAALPVVSCSGITIAQQPLGQIHWKSTTTKLIVHSTIPFNFSVVALFFVGRGTIIIMSIHHNSKAYILIITITTSADSSDQNNIIFSYEAAYIRQNIMYTTMNQLMHQIQQSTNNMTIIHPWQSYKFSSTQLWSCCSAGSLSHTSQTAAAWLSPHITVVHVMVFKVGQEWFSSAKPWTTLVNDLICLNCNMDDLPRCLTSAAFNRRNDGHYSRSQYHI